MRSLSLIFLLFFSLSVFAEDILDESKPPRNENTYLSTIMRLPSLRFYIDDSAGLGHQSHTSLIIRRLRGEGYRGEIEIFYLSPEKIAPFFPNFNAAMDFQKDQKNRLIFYKLPASPFTWDPSTRIIPYNFQLAPLIITGGEDSAFFNTQYLRDILRAQSILALNPFEWVSESYIQGQDGRRVEFNTLNSFYTRSTEYEWNGQSLETSLISMFEKMSSERFVIPFYSHEEFTVSSLVRLVLALKRTQINQSITIIVFNTLTETQRNRIEKLLETKWNSSQARINLVYVGTVNSATFNHIFYESGFPLVIVSGRNSIAQAWKVLNHI